MSPAISTRSARDLLRALRESGPVYLSDPERMRIAAELESALKPRKPISAKAARNARLSWERLAVIRDECFVRASGVCEAGCGRLGEEADHFFGRARAESFESVWWLCGACHKAKTNSRPNAAQWLTLFADHCDRHGFAREAARARARLLFVETRSQFSKRGAP